MLIEAKRLLPLIRNALIDRIIDESLFSSMSDLDWMSLLDYASKQGFTAVGFQAFEKSLIRPHMDVLMEWLGQASFVESRYSE